MTLPERPFRGNLIESFRHAFHGLQYVLRAERNVRVHLMIASVVTVVGLWLGLDAVEWALIVFAIALVLVGELINSVTELTIDLVCPNYDIRAKHAKDMVAAAILVAALASVCIGVLVLGPPLLAKVSALFRG
ncbi:MAG: diacylglycerol kinase family protein [Anaerolineae bacterium]